MKNRFSIICCSVLLLIAVSYSAVNYPYPQRKNYGNNTINATSLSASANLKQRFQAFVRDFYEEGRCNGTPCARIKFDELQYTVSEGIGYGMLMMVYFSDTAKSYEEEFKKLWVYYKNFTNNNGVMHWKIEGFNSINQQNGATDAEYDVALALVMARYQFGNAQYETDAKDLMAKSLTHEHNSDGLHKPGDAWDADKNPSYVAPAAYKIFEEVSGDPKWATVLTRNYTFLEANQNGTTGLPSGWANADGSVKSCSSCGYSPSDNYNQDAVRAPWRWATANAWFGQAKAKTLLTKLGTWVNSKDPSDVKGPITLSGSWGTDGNSSYVGSLACALTANSSHQARLNEYWTVLNGIGTEPYFNQAMRVLTGLLITGNMPNLKACASGGTNPCGTDMPSGGTAGSGVSIDKFSIGDEEAEDERGYARTWEPWYAYTDVGTEAGKRGKSTISNEKFQTKDEHDNCKEITSYKVVLKEDGEWAARIPSYELIKGCTGTTLANCENATRYAAFVALGLNAKYNGRNYDLSQCTGGFSYEYKGQGHNFKVQTSVITAEGSDHFTAVSVPTTSWTTQTVELSELKQPTWVTAAADKHDFDPTKIIGFIWELKGDDAGAVDGGISKDRGSLAIKNFRCLGNFTVTGSRPDLVCSDWSEPYNPSRIGMSPFASSNALVAMQNSVNLQVAGSATVQIFDLRGNAVRTLKVARGSHTLSLSDLPRGMYIVKASHASWNKTVKIAVK